MIRCGGIRSRRFAGGVGGKAGVYPMLRKGLRRWCDDPRTGRNSQPLDDTMLIAGVFSVFSRVNAVAFTPLTLPSLNTILIPGDAG